MYLARQAIKSNIKQNDVSCPITWGTCCLGLRLHVESRFYVSSNCTLTWLFPKWVKCGDSTSAKSMQHFYLNDELDSRSLQFIRHRYISFGVFCFFLFSFLAKTLSSRKTKTQNWAFMSAYSSQTLLQWLHLQRIHLKLLPSRCSCSWQSHRAAEKHLKCRRGGASVWLMSAAVHSPWADSGRGNVFVLLQRDALPNTVLLLDSSCAALFLFFFLIHVILFSWGALLITSKHSFTNNHRYLYWMTVFKARWHKRGFSLSPSNTKLRTCLPCLLFFWSRRYRAGWTSSGHHWAVQSHGQG